MQKTTINVAIFLLFVIVFTAWTENFLKNPSFEDVDVLSPDRPKWWDRLCTVQEGASLVHDDAKAFDGKRSLRLEAKNHLKDNDIVIWRHPKLGTAMQSLPEGTEMELSMNVFAEEQNKCIIYFPFVGVSKEVSTPLTVINGGWKLIKTTFKLEHHPVGNIYIRTYGTGRVWVDSVYLGPARKSENDTKPQDAKRPFAEWKPSPNGDRNDCRIVTPGLKTSHALFLQSAKDGSCPAWSAQYPAAVLSDAVPEREFAFRINANTHGIAATCFTLSLVLQTDDGGVVSFASPPISIYQGTEKASLKFKMPQQKIKGIKATVTLTTEGRLTFDSPEFIPAEDDADNGAFATKDSEYCRILGQPQRRTWRKSSLPTTLKIGCNLPADTLKISVLNILKEKEIASISKNGLKPHEDIVLEIPTPLFETAAYEFIFESGEGPAALREYDYIRVVPDDFSQRISFRGDKSFIVDGKPFFPIINSYTLRTPESFRVNSLSGINVMNVMASEDPGEWRYLNSVARQYGVFLTWWNHYIYTGQYSDERIRSQLANIEFVIDGMDRLIGFEDDESAWCGLSSEWMRKATRMYFAMFPHHFLHENHAPVMHGPPSDFRRAFHNIRRFSCLTDTASVDIYPVPDGRASYADLPSGNCTLSCVGEFTDEVRRSSWNERPVMMVLQNWSLSEVALGKPTAERPRPTRHELRFMAWNAITHGANGIFWHGEGNETGHGGNADFYSEYWQGFADVNKEISKAMELYMSLYGGETDTVTHHGRVRSIARASGDRAIVVAVNEDRYESHEFTLPLKGDFYASPNGAKVASTVTLKPYEVLVASTEMIVIQPTARFTPETPESEIPCPYKSVLIEANWTSHPEFPRTNGAMSFLFKHEFEIPEGAKEILLQICGDDSWRCSIGDFNANGKEHTTVYQFDLSGRLSKGKHILTGTLENINGTTGIVYAILCDGKPVAASGKDTLFSVDGKTDWRNGLERGNPPIAPWGRPERFIKQ